MTTDNLTEEPRGPDLSERLDAFFTNPSADCRTTDWLRHRKAEILRHTDHDPKLREIDRVLRRRKSQVEK